MSDEYDEPGTGKRKLKLHKRAALSAGGRAANAAKSMLAGFSLSGARFKLPATYGEVREPAWSNFLR